MSQSPATTYSATPAGESIAREFLLRVGPVAALMLLAGVGAGFWQHGYLPGAGASFPLAGIQVPLWHVFWMGLWTGYTMALVGEASGIFALPYSMSILQFASPSVTPTTQVLTFLNPVGALLGYRRSGQWNLDLAKWVCLGGVVGGLAGPFLRVTFFSEPKPFQFLVGAVLAFVGVHMLYAAAAKGQTASAGRPGPRAAHIRTLDKSQGRLLIEYGSQSWSISVPGLFISGVAVGVLASALGVGGGFLLVPIFVAFYRLPMYVLVAASIPYVIVLSAVGLISYVVILPMFGMAPVHPEWTWGLFAASGGVIGSWFAAKTQRWIPEHLLKLMLGSVTSLAGTLYVVNYFFELPFKL